MAAKYRLLGTKRRPTNLCSEKLACPIFIWAVLSTISMVVTYIRLSNGVLIHDLCTNATKNTYYVNCTTNSEASYYMFTNSICSKVLLTEDCGKNVSNLFLSKSDCVYYCGSKPSFGKLTLDFRVPNKAPFGATLMMGSFGLSILLIFAFVCIPYDSDKNRLRSSLKIWLILDLILMTVVAITSLTGAVFIVQNDPKRFNNESLLISRLLWDLTLVLAPLVVLTYHIYIWRHVYWAYKCIDTSKPVLHGVWSADV